MRNWLKKQFTFDRNSLAFFWLFIPILTLVVVNRYAPRKMPGDTQAQIQIYQDTALNGKANILLEGLLDEKPLDIDLNYRYLQNNCETFLGLNDTWRGDKNTLDRYHNLSQVTESSDIGYYSLGYIESGKKNYQTALDYFLLVENKDLKYLNNSIGYVYKSLGEEQKAESYYQREIVLKGYIEGAVINLAELYEKQGAIQKLGTLVQNESTKAYVRLGPKATWALRSGNILRYLELIYIRPFGYINGFAAGFALLVCGIWFYYLLRINLYTLEPVFMGILALLAGAFMALSCFIMYDLWFMVNPIVPGERTLENAIYFFCHVGVIEEFVKFIPIVMIVVFTRDRINGPLDLVIFGGLSALGFATLENSLYFSMLGIRIVPARFIISTFLHMVETMLLCYLWARARYMKMGNEVLAIIFGFCLVVVSHGLFDFLLTENIPVKILLAGAQVVILSFLFGYILHNCIYFSPRSPFILTSLTTRRFNNYQLFFSAISGLLTLSYLHTNFKYATEIANIWFAAIFIFSIICIWLLYYPLVTLGYLSPPSRIFPIRITHILVKPFKIYHGFDQSPCSPAT